MRCLNAQSLSEPIVADSVWPWIVEERKAKAEGDLAMTRKELKADQAAHCLCIYWHCRLQTVMYHWDVPVCTSQIHCLSGATKKHAKKFSIKNFGTPKTPPLDSLCGPFSCILKGKEAPNIKNLRGQGYLGGGVWEGGFLPEFFISMPSFSSGVSDGG